MVRINGCLKGCVFMIFHDLGVFPDMRGPQNYWTSGDWLMLVELMQRRSFTHRIHVWYIYLHLYTVHLYLDVPGRVEVRING